ncbi:MAG: histidine kinase internal region [Gemmatimonadetes bacterium]|nr:histidine kinase internal region [Gemmatimonadota bacterium]
MRAHWFFACRCHITGEPRLAFPRPSSCAIHRIVVLPSTKPGSPIHARHVLLPLGAVLFVSTLTGLQAKMRYPEIRTALHLIWEVPPWITWWALAPIIFYLTRRFPVDERHWRRSVPVHLAASLASPLIHLSFVAAVRQVFAFVLLSTPVVWTAIEHEFFHDNTDIASMLEGYPRLFAFPVILYAATVVLSQSLTYREALAERLLQQARLETLLAHSQLQSLKWQLQPHFLFNTLNTVGALMSSDKATARRVLAKLGDLLRLTLTDADAHEWTLSRELAFIDDYLVIQYARFRDALEVTIDVDEGTRTQQVPRLLLQPLIENAIEHGSSRSGVLRVRVVARASGTSLLLEVSDNGGGFAEPHAVAMGVGLTNTRERLSRLHGERGRMVLDNTPDGGARVTIHLPLIAAITEETLKTAAVGDA